ncbi:MAG TPA: Pvc16 family protein, partial [Iamia sp.]|nr:Pvc16 family protein [Iamia sp.]
MSSALALATVTAVLQARITTLLDRADLTGFTTRATHPTKADEPGVYLHLYEVVPNPALRNEMTPERAADGTVVRRPRLALD